MKQKSLQIILQLENWISYFCVLVRPKADKRSLSEPEFCRQTTSPNVFIYETDLGLVISNGIHWQNIRRFTLRIRQDLDNQEVLDFDKLFQQIQENAELIMIQDFFPWEIINDHIKTLDLNDPRDYIDDYLIEMEKQKDDPSSTMSSVVER
ncbi:hypothetical protein Avbf_12467 [Armadillidium vulgare]|nr:hypothetical protein Avbf_12467 [Armadillidium vulgare]